MVCSGCVSVRKWVLIFLLLTNVLVFFGYSMLMPRWNERAISAEGGVELRLISEMPESLLVRKESSVSSSVSKDGGRGRVCWYYNAVQNRDQVNALTTFFQEQAVVSDLDVQLPTQGSGSIMLMTETDQEVIRRLNAVIKSRYPHINIEKKLCKGVASP